MQVIRLKPRLIPLVKTGVKCSTIRAGVKSQYTLGPSIITDGSDNLEVFVNKIELRRWGSLAEDDAEREGYSSVEELHAVLHECYPDLSFTPGSVLTLIQFKPWRSIGRSAGE
jgi:hypothetical protein